MHELPSSHVRAMSALPPESGQPSAE